ncbi:oxidoreductase-like protein [Massariosphaeria phaeospora]|uniref:Oxidoreductase-like protein n=1 Tax=Massariosphaeria phaeospora TaxID=100035 RepID=A0A7C8M806_9PLEO|nr:oxidoreductase-like protein [Massariosphaeria phaeospora]
MKKDFMMAFSLATSWNEGETTMQKLLRVPDMDNPTSQMLTPQAANMLQRGPLLIVGTLDAQDRPWTTLWGGQPGFSRPLGGNIIGTSTIVDGVNDPVVQALVGHVESGEMVQGAQKMISGLTLDLMTRKRVKLAGRMVAGTLEEVDVEYAEGAERPGKVASKQHQLQLGVNVEQSVGNCPKYMNQYDLRPALVTSEIISQSSSLSLEAKALIAKADMFFLSSSTPKDMDTNHRGGPSGFVRVLSDTEFVYPEYSGNRFYQSLGNLYMNPKIGITFPDYESGNVLYTTGHAEILIGNDAASLLPGSNLALRIKIDEARLVRGGLPFRGTKKNPSPYNPLVRTLATEGNIKSNISASRKTAQLKKKVSITHTVSRYTFSVPDGLTYTPGQWVAFDFSSEMDHGYSHMRDDDPLSLNDDWVRTFTISSTPSSKDSSKEKEFDITIRTVGSVTDFLSRQNERASFEVPILGVGGDFKIVQEEGKLAAFFAAGVGITPLLGQLSGLDVTPERFRLLWTVRLMDAGLVVDTLLRYAGLAGSTEVYLTRFDGQSKSEENITALKKLGAKVQTRRLTKSDLDDLDAGTWYLCAAKPLRKDVLSWLGGKKVVFEDFDY